MKKQHAPAHAGKALSGPPAAADSQTGLPLPHERDQSSGHVADDIDPVIEQAHKDLAAGQVDTDMRATPGLDAARRDRLVGTPSPHKALARTKSPRR